MLNLKNLKRDVLPDIAAVEISDKNVVSGKSIGDLPTSYRVPSMKPHEKLVIGTYVHPDIVPGFHYNVRLNNSAEFLFGGRSLLLESIGQGYGKRFTFESDDILNNNNFFWSDSNFDDGFAFAINVLNVGEIYDAFKLNSKVGTIKVLEVSPNQEIISSKNNSVTLEHEKKVLVNFQCSMLVDGKESFHKEVFGYVLMTKNAFQQKAVLKDFQAFFMTKQEAYVLKQTHQSY